MKKLPPPLEQLLRPEVTQLLLTSGRPPRAVVGDGFETLGPPLTSEAIVALLFASGGSRYLEELGPRPTTWKLKLDGVGNVSVSAAQHGDDFEAQFTAPPGRAPVVPRRQTTPPPTRRGSSERGDARSAMVTKPVRQRSSGGVRATRNAATDRPAGRKPSGSGNDGPPTSRRPRRVDGEAAPRSLPAESARAVEIHEGDPGTPFDIEIVTPRTSVAPRVSAHLQPFKHSRPSRFLELIETSRGEGASDLHIAAGRPGAIRLAGELVSRGQTLEAAEVEAMMEACTPERLKPQLKTIGSCDFAFDVAGLGRFRANVARQRNGLKIALRLIGREIPTLAGLGLPPELAGVAKYHHGLVVVTGPTGHGKTTTLAALVDLLNRETTHHVITVEDPVEYVHPRIRALVSQREVGVHTRSFASALKAALREDPDVIVVGELRDTETVQMALAASETGHLVLGTMNTPSAAKTIDRLVDLFPPADHSQVRATLAGGLKMVVSQRLVPQRDKAGLAVAVELLPGSLALWNLIRENKTFQIPSLMQRGRGLGVIRLNDSLAELVAANRVDAAAAIAASDSPEELDAMVHRRAPAPPSAYAPPSNRPAEPQDTSKNLFQRAGALFGKKGGS